MPTSTTVDELHTLCTSEDVDPGDMVWDSFLPLLKVMGDDKDKAQQVVDRFVDQVPPKVMLMVCLDCVPHVAHLSQDGRRTLAQVAVTATARWTNSKNILPHTERVFALLKRTFPNDLASSVAFHLQLIREIPSDGFLCERFVLVCLELLEETVCQPDSVLMDLGPPIVECLFRLQPFSTYRTVLDKRVVSTPSSKVQVEHVWFDDDIVDLHEFTDVCVHDRPFGEWFRQQAPTLGVACLAFLLVVHRVQVQHMPSIYTFHAKLAMFSPHVTCLLSNKGSDHQLAVAFRGFQLAAALCASPNPAQQYAVPRECEPVFLDLVTKCMHFTSSNANSKARTMSFRLLQAIIRSLEFHSRFRVVMELMNKSTSSPMKGLLLDELRRVLASHSPRESDEADELSRAVIKVAFEQIDHAGNLAQDMDVYTAGLSLVQFAVVREQTSTTRDNWIDAGKVQTLATTLQRDALVYIKSKEQELQDIEDAHYDDEDKRGAVIRMRGDMSTSDGDAPSSDSLFNEQTAISAMPLGNVKNQTVAEKREMVVKEIFRTRMTLNMSDRILELLSCPGERDPVA